MRRLIGVSLLAAALCSLESGCCGCCRMFAGMGGGGGPRFVINQPPVVQQPPPPIEQPFQGNPNPFPGPKEYTYSQSTGQFKLGNDLIGTGYSGNGAARNQPAMQDRPNMGPIPVGTYVITGRKDEKGEPEIDLMPEAQTNTFGRWPGERFAIQADTVPPGNAPGGRIVLPRDARSKIDTAPFTKVRVVP
jgi:hypothetical protein